MNRVFKSVGVVMAVIALIVLSPIFAIGVVVGALVRAFRLGWRATFSMGGK